MGRDEFADGFWLEACGFVAFMPVAGSIGRGSGMCGFGADAHKTSGEIPKDCAGGFDGDEMVFRLKSLDEVFNGVEQHGLATGEDDMLIFEFRAF